MTGRRLQRNGFTLIELLLALMVTAIILSAVVSLAFALNSANEGTANMSRNQAVLRYATLRIRDLIRFSNSVVSASADGIEFWADSNADGIAGADEKFFIEKGAGGTSLVYRDSTGKIVSLVGVCSNINIRGDVPVPNTRFVSVSFDMESETGTYNYETSGALLCRSN